MATTTLSVPEIHCDHCRAAIEGALSPIDGVEGIDVDLEQRVVRLEHDDELELGFELLGRRLARTTLAYGPGPTQDAADQTVLVQAFVAGDEYSLDLVCDLSGRYVTTLAKQKLGLRAGDTDSAVTVSDPALTDLGRDLCRALGPVGVADCDVFVGAEGPTVLELNPRFGNAYPFAHVAGADLPAAVVAWARGDLPEPGWLRAEPGVTAARYSRLMLTSPG